MPDSATCEGCFTVKRLWKLFSLVVVIVVAVPGGFYLGMSSKIDNLQTGLSLKLDTVSVAMNAHLIEAAEFKGEVRQQIKTLESR